jgi:pimeloyl-ACP methyl ester carboxylesterase
LAVLLYLAVFSYTPRIRDRYGRTLPASIATLEKVTIGGVDQYVLIRARDRSSPVVLFLHGGPGMPTMFLAHEFQAPLENDFVVVQWDRRGAGKSYKGDVAPESMSVEQEISDTRELATLLSERFHQDKVYLVGFSYGSYLGMLVANRYPELFRAYVGMGQEGCSQDREHGLQDTWIRQQALARGDREALRQLEGQQPLDRERWLFKYGAEIHRATNWYPLLWAGFTAPEYNLVDVLNVKKGVTFSARNLKFNAIRGALMDEITSLEVPVHFFTGRFDYTDPVPCTLEYFERLRAPEKHLVWFERSAHFLFLEEPDKFAEELRRVAATTRQ